MHEKIKSLSEIQKILEKLREKKKKVIQCHGVFDLLHPGHILHFKEAKKQGDCLVVSITQDKYVNKGPGRPVFTESLRLQSIASLTCVDYVVLNDSSDAISCIKKIKPDVYVKGKEYKKHAEDVTGKIEKEAEAVEEVQGNIYYTDDLVFSSSSLLNRFFDPLLPTGVQTFIKKIKDRYSLNQIQNFVEDLSDLKVLIIGDAILDEYQYVDPLGQSGKGLHMVAKCLEKEVFLGGSLIIANHIASFTKNITLLSSMGKRCPYKSFIDQALDPSVQTHFIESTQDLTLKKKRYVLKDGNNLTKLFETYSSNTSLLNDFYTQNIVNYLQALSSDQFDLVLVADFGNGFLNDSLREAICNIPHFLAINTQLNSGNRGYNVITNYKRADFVSLNEPELRLATHDRQNLIEKIIHKISQKLQTASICVTKGIKGLVCYEPHLFEPIPAFTTSAIDRVGAGDSFFSLAALSAAKKQPLLISGLLGSLAAAIDVQVIGNKESVKKISVLKYLNRILK